MDSLNGVLIAQKKEEAKVDVAGKGWVGVDGGGLLEVTALFSTETNHQLQYPLG